MKRQLSGKTLLAIAFVGGVLNSQHPASSENKSESKDSLIYQIANSKINPPENRAYYLLKIAAGYLNSSDRMAVERHYKVVADNGAGVTSIFRDSDMEAILVSWAEKVASEESSQDPATSGKADETSNLKSRPDEHSQLANDAIQKSLIQLAQTSEEFAKLHMYFIASRLLKRMGDTDGERKCNAVLERAFKSCAKGSVVDEEQMRAVISILSAKAYGFIPIQIPLQNPDEAAFGRVTKIFSEQDFIESEKLRLRAVSMADRLDTQNQLRRRAHRDLALWYMELGKVQLAEKEKRTLFDLVGIQDESILYPQSESCSSVVWWTREKKLPLFNCGRG